MCQSSQWSCIASMCKVRVKQHPPGCGVWWLLVPATPLWQLELGLRSGSVLERRQRGAPWYPSVWCWGVVCSSPCWWHSSHVVPSAGAWCSCSLRNRHVHRAASLLEYCRFISLGTIPLWGSKGNPYHLNGDDSQSVTLKITLCCVPARSYNPAFPALAARIPSGLTE